MPDRLPRDLRFALRSLRKTPGFATMVVITIALVVGANATAFTVLDQVLFRSLPYGDAGRLYSLFQQSKRGGQRLPSYPSFQDWTRDSKSFLGIAFIRGTGAILRTDEGRFRAVQGFVSPGFFRLMERAPLVGRTFSPDEEAAGGPDVAVLSYRFWRERFGGDSAIVGRAIRLDTASTIVIGVMPRGFDYPPFWSLWRPIARVATRDPALANRAFHVDSRVIGRLAPGVDSARAMTELGSIQRRLAESYPEEGRDWTGAAALPLRSEILGDVRPRILVITAAALLVLVIACANLAALGLLRASARSREMAIRLAIGATGRNIGAHLAIEGLLLATIGGVMGCALASASAAWLRKTGVFGLLRADDFIVDGRALALGAVLPLATILIVSTVPALRLLMADRTESLLGRRAAGGATRRESRSRNIFTAVQFAVALMLLVGAGLLVRSYRHLQAVRPGFDPENLMSLHIVTSRAQYPNAAALRAFYDRILTRLASVPGVEHVGLINLFGGGVPTPLEFPGRPVSADDQAMYRSTSDGYLPAVGAPLVHGRWFTADEMRTPGDAIVVSESVARRYWPNESALGKPITVFRSSQTSADFGKRAPGIVVGVVGDRNSLGLGSQAIQDVYVPYAAEPWPHVELLVRVRDTTPAMGVTLRRAVAEVDPEIGSMSTKMDDPFTPVLPSLESALVPQRYLAQLIAALGAFALFLACLGIYAVTSYAVARRAHEFGVRMALGATPRDVLGLVVRRGIALAAAGVGAGLIGALALTRLLERLLFETSPTDLGVFVAVPVLLLLVAATASYLPARRAARVDPVAALAEE